MSVIVQLSDLHLVKGGALAYGRIDTLDGLRRAVAHLQRLDAAVGGIDAIVVTGDLTDHGEPEAYALFREMTAPLRAPVHVLPGNHDLREPMRAAFAPDGHVPPEGPLDHAVDVGPLTLILLDDLVEGEPWGALSAAQCAWLDGVLAARPDRPALLFLHHPPFDSGIGHMDANRLRDAEGLAAVVSRRRNVRLIGCGHIHRAVTSLWAGAPAMIAPAPAHSVSLDLRSGAEGCFSLEPGGVLVHRFTGEGLGEVVSQTSFIDPWPGPYPFRSPPPA